MNYAPKADKIQQNLKTMTRPISRYEDDKTQTQKPNFIDGASYLQRDIKSVNYEN